MERSIVVCEECANIYTGRVDDDGTIILPLDDQTCHCGGSAFDTIDSIGADGIAG
jgi:hypothetical protein